MKTERGCETVKWQKCPVCDGVGQVSGGYFNRAGDCQQWMSSDAIEVCLVCKGTGMVIEPTISDNKEA